MWPITALTNIDQLKTGLTGLRTRWFAIFFVRCRLSFYLIEWKKLQKPYTLFESENERQKIEPVPIPLGDNPIYPFCDADGQDQEIFLRCQKMHFLQLSNFAIISYGHFPTRNGLKLSKVSILFWHFWKNLLALFKSQIVWILSFRPFVLGKWP